jgi:hypothetical protein
MRRAALVALVATMACGDSKKSGAPTPGGVADAGDVRTLPGGKPVYPSTDLPPDPITVKLCQAIWTVPARRQAECCRTSIAPTPASECARILTFARGDHAIDLDPAEVERCAQGAEAAFVGCDWVRPGPAPAIPACRGVVKGLRSAGMVCRSSFECRAGLVCEGVTPSATGKCAPPLAEGAGCAAAGDALAAVLGEPAASGCAGWCRAGKCARFAAFGGACASDEECGGGGWCASGKCVQGGAPVVKNASPYCTAPGD